MLENKVYFCIDLKTFYASVECVERHLDPFSTNLVVADPSRGKGAICLAVSPKMKMLGVKNRCRLYEIPKNIDYMIAMPRMEKYIEYSANIYEMYLKYFSKDDIHVYSIDEVFIDASKYFKLYKVKPLELVQNIIKKIKETTGITATAGVGTNMYLAKVALDITAKHSVSNIGYLDEEKYKKELGNHRPLTDFWQIGKGISESLRKMGIYTMNDIANTDPRKLYNKFGVNAKFLIDHSKGIEPCTIQEIKGYKPKSNSISTNQILFKDYNYQDALLVTKEMVELLSLELINKNLKTESINLYIGYSKDCIEPSKGSKRLEIATNTYTDLLEEYEKLYIKIVSKIEPIRRIGISFGRLSSDDYEQLNLFVNQEKKDKEKNIERTINIIKSKFGKNLILKGINLQENATTTIRNKLIGGHNAY